MSAQSASAPHKPHDSICSSSTIGSQSQRTCPAVFQGIVSAVFSKERHLLDDVSAWGSFLATTIIRDCFIPIIENRRSNGGQLCQDKINRSPDYYFLHWSGTDSNPTSYTQIYGGSKHFQCRTFLLSANAGSNALNYICYMSGVWEGTSRVELQLTITIDTSLDADPSRFIIAA